MQYWFTLHNIFNESVYCVLLNERHVLIIIACYNNNIKCVIEFKTQRLFFFFFLFNVVYVVGFLVFFFFYSSWRVEQSIRKYLEAIHKVNQNFTFFLFYSLFYFLCIFLSIGYLIAKINKTTFAEGSYLIILKQIVLKYRMEKST